MTQTFVARMERLRLAVPVLVSVLMFAVLPAAFADSLQFTLLPNTGDISGGPGSTVGWGYSITNQSSADWLVTTGLNADSFLHGTPTLLFDFPTLGPGQTATESFGASTGVGLYELMWDADAPMGFVNSGDFVLSARWWDADPAKGGNFIADSPDTTVAYSAVGSSTTTPEPSTTLLLLIAAAFAVTSALLRNFKYQNKVPKYPG